MERIFIFALGATGARVLRSLTMLLASGQLADKVIVPIIIDFNKDNGNRVQTLTLLHQYAKIRKSLSSNEDCSNSGFFNAALMGISDIYGDIHSLNFEVYFDIKNYYPHSIAAYHSLGGDTLTTKKLIDSLINTECLDLRSRISDREALVQSTIISNEIFDTLELKHFQNIVTPNDSVIIISSSWGATGSAILCRLLPWLKGIPFHVKTAVCLLSNPYFSITENHNAELNTEKMHKRANAFVHYFKKTGLQDMADTTLLITSNNLYPVYHNIPDGPDQLDPAHLTELYAAKSVVDYCNGHPVLECNLVPNKIDITNYNDENYKELIESLSAMAMFSMWYKKNIIEKYTLTHEPLMMLCDQQCREEGGFYSDLNKFIDEYISWCQELSGDKDNSNIVEYSHNESPVQLFRYSENLENLIVGREPPEVRRFFLLTRRFNFTSDLDGYIKNKINHALHIHPTFSLHDTNLKNKESVFMQSIYDAMKDASYNVLNDPNN